MILYCEVMIELLHYILAEEQYMTPAALPHGASLALSP
jgi:hypothetical protein